eukprot:evm.model.scf_709EXC.8 EVM.evm.TU.scf_709EXC.8   scf_709EXC:60379-67519(-)
MGSLQSAVLGFGAFKALQKCGLGRGFSMAENVILQTTAVATATMPLTAGYVGIIPALGMLTPTDNPPNGHVVLSVLQLILWSLAVAYLGVFTAVPLRAQTIVRERLRFPSGAATAKVIQLMHNESGVQAYERLDNVEGGEDGAGIEERAAGAHTGISSDAEHLVWASESPVPPQEIPEIGRAGTMQSLLSSLSAKMRSIEEEEEGHEELGVSGDWKTSCVALLVAFSFAFLYKMVAELVAVCHSDGLPTEVEGQSCRYIFKDFPVFSWLGFKAATEWGWILSLKMGYIGQGMIMGPRTCWSMLAGALTGFAWLGPIARRRGWAPGPISSTENGATGWVLWVSLAVMLSDSLMSLLLLLLATLVMKLGNRRSQRHVFKAAPTPDGGDIPTSWWVGGLLAATVLCTAVVSPMFSMAVYEPIVAVLLALLVAVLAVRALGETDLNPVSGVGKISQIVFAGLAPGRVVPNLIAGAIAEAGATQAGDMMQDFKTAHLLGVSPRPQFIAQLIGATLSVGVSVVAYDLFTSAWPVPGPELKVPTASMWLDMARLFNGGSLPAKVAEFAAAGAALAAAVVILQHYLKFRSLGPYAKFLPSGIGFAVGMYVGPQLTLPRFLGSLAEQVWLWASPASHASLMIVVASGLVLGEGTAAIVVATVKASQA